MAQFENIDPFAFLGVECNIPIGEIITASRKLDYLNSMVASVDIPATVLPVRSSLQHLPTPIIPAKNIIVTEKASSDNFWFWLFVIVLVLIAAGSIWYFLKKEKKEENARFKELALLNQEK